MINMPNDNRKYFKFTIMYELFYTYCLYYKIITNTKTIRLYDRVAFDNRSSQGQQLNSNWTQFVFSCRERRLRKVLGSHHRDKQYHQCLQQALNSGSVRSDQSFGKIVKLLILQNNYIDRNIFEYYFYDF